MMESKSSLQRRSFVNWKLAWLYLQIFHGIFGLGFGPCIEMDTGRPKWSLDPRGGTVEQLLVRSGLLVSMISIVVTELSVTRVCPVGVTVSEN